MIKDCMEAKARYTPLGHRLFPMLKSTTLRLTYNSYRIARLPVTKTVVETDRCEQNVNKHLLVESKAYLGLQKVINACLL